MTAVLFLVVAIAIGAVGIAAGIIVAPILTRVSDRLSAETSEERPPRDEQPD